MEPINHYNSFLQDTSTEHVQRQTWILIQQQACSHQHLLPTFQVTPIYSVHNSTSKVQSDLDSDPFGTFSSSDQAQNESNESEEFFR